MRRPAYEAKIAAMRAEVLEELASEICRLDKMSLQAGLRERNLQGQLATLRGCVLVGAVILFIYLAVSR